MASEDDDDVQTFDRRIMIASIFFLLAVALLMFFLHFYMKYLHRRRELRRAAAIHRLISRQIVPEATNSNPITQTPKSGLEPTVLASLPAFKFNSDQNRQFEDGEITECSVCLGAIVENNMVRVLPNCKHMFHNDCIDAWFKSNVTCPICRTVVDPRVKPESEKMVLPSAPPLEGNDSRSGGSSFRFGSFRWMIRGRDRSSMDRRCGDDVIGGGRDLERQ